MIPQNRRKTKELIPEINDSRFINFSFITSTNKIDDCNLNNDESYEDDDYRMMVILDNQ